MISTHVRPFLVSSLLTGSIWMTPQVFCLTGRSFFVRFVRQWLSSHLNSGSRLGGVYWLLPFPFVFSFVLDFVVHTFSLPYFQPRKKAKLMAEDSIVLEMAKNSLQGDVNWASPNGTTSSEGMTSTADLLEDIEKVLVGDVGSLGSLSLRDPESFRAGEIYAHPDHWKIISAGYIREAGLNEWISRGVNIQSFSRPFKAVFKRVKYDCRTPPQKAFKNHPSCKKFADFITGTLNQ